MYNVDNYKLICIEVYETAFLTSIIIKKFYIYNYINKPKAFKIYIISHFNSLNKFTSM